MIAPTDCWTVPRVHGLISPGAARFGRQTPEPPCRAAAPNSARGSARRHSRLPQDVTPSAEHWVAFPDPPIAGIQLSEFFRKHIIGDHALLKLTRSARYFGVEITIPAAFRPAVFSLEEVVAYHDALAVLNGDPRGKRFRRLLDHLWTRGPGVGGLPLDLRMALTPRIDLGEGSSEQSADSLLWQDSLRIARTAARRRDLLVASLCDSLRSLRWQAAGFQPGDVSRTLSPIVKEWWGDRHMICRWIDDQIAPSQETTPGRPTFLSISFACLIRVPAAAHENSRGAAQVENDCLVWLVRSWPASDPQAKSAWLTQARGQFGSSLSEAAFNRAWSEAAQTHVAMSAKGRPPGLNGQKKTKTQR